MTTIRRLLAQDEIWHPKNANPIRLQAMAPSHRRNLLAWLRRRAPRLKESTAWSYLTGPGPSGDMACDAFDRELDELDAQDPQAWLAEQPLVIRLANLIAADRAAALRAAAGHIPAGADAALRRQRRAAAQRAYQALASWYLNGLDQPDTPSVSYAPDGLAPTSVHELIQALQDDDPDATP
jgi:hypothetical protein